MHIMYVRGVYVTDPTRNIIFGGKWPALSGRVFLICFLKVFGSLSFGSTVAMFFVILAV